MLSNERQDSFPEDDLEHASLTQLDNQSTINCEFLMSGGAYVRFVALVCDGEYNRS